MQFSQRPQFNAEAGRNASQRERSVFNPAAAVGSVKHEYAARVGGAKGTSQTSDGRGHPLTWYSRRESENCLLTVGVNEPLGQHTRMYPLERCRFR